ncbi:hypothetical protein B0A52_08450 [Exophiala mesophila]|uniref:Uncharacterized protein n=1 Tax=Exophiala mesophila TaxID=212818 RepID=A0A438MYJ4_EXOME|nr:hypothetical protein B0A52_08450 [Exophiala mesophila]
MILERFDSLIFVGDDSLQSIYNGFNILLRQDLIFGAMRVQEMESALRTQCWCDSQFTAKACSRHFVTASHQVPKDVLAEDSVSFCRRTPHTFLRIDGNSMSSNTLNSFKMMIPSVPTSNYKAVPIILSLQPATCSQESASRALLEILGLADESKRKTPMLWVGPSAAGHVEVKDRKGNQEIWEFDRHMEHVALENDIEVLKMWNMTVQAESWDGVQFGEKVAVTQAMMLINWLSLLESS